MDNQSVAPILETLEDLYSKFNVKIFNKELDKPIITISPNPRSPNAYGWFTLWKAWGTGDDGLANHGFDHLSDAKAELSGYNEINICAEYLSRPMEEVAGTLLHEMVHLYNWQNGIQDCSRGGYYHNKKFKEAAEAHGLLVMKTPSHGYSETALNPETKAFLSSLDISDFSLYRRSYGTNAEMLRRGLTLYCCPNCTQRVFAASLEIDVNIICGHCNEKLIEFK